MGNMLIVNGFAAKQYRENLGLTQKEAAKIAQISVRTVSKIEAAAKQGDGALKSVNPELNTINGLALAYRVTPYALLRDIDEPPVASPRCEIPLEETRKEHKCRPIESLLGRMTAHGLCGPVISDVYVDSAGRFWASNNEYQTQVYYCPFCGLPAPTTTVLLPEDYEKLEY